MTAKKERKGFALHAEDDLIPPTKEGTSEPDYKAELDLARIRIGELEMALIKIRHLGEYGSVANRQEIIHITNAALEIKE